MNLKNLRSWKPRFSRVNRGEIITPTASGAEGVSPSSPLGAWRTPWAAQLPPWRSPLVPGALPGEAPPSLVLVLLEAASLGGWAAGGRRVRRAGGRDGGHGGEHPGGGWQALSDEAADSNAALRRVSGSRGAEEVRLDMGPGCFLL